MTQYSYSRVSLFEDCPYHFKLRYIDKLTELPKLDADNPLIIGSALHKGIETNVETALNEYFNSFPVLTDKIIEESMKLEILIPKAKDFLAQNFVGFELIHEYFIDKPNYRGYVDLILVAPNGESMVIDFKYSNHIKNYLDSGQLHIYKHYLEQDGFDVKKMGYLFVPKTGIKQKKTEDLMQFRKRLVETVKASKVSFVPIEYDEMNVLYFQNSIEKIESAKSYPKNVSGNCFACNPRFEPDYLEVITNYKGEEIMTLPSAQRRNIEKVTKRVFWLYGAPFTGKTTFANEFPNPLMLNTDGNIRFVDAPYISIANKVTTEGRRTITTLAWDIFKDTISELEKKDNDFKTIIVDLLEDTYEACRIYMYDKLGIEHEADNSFKAWDMVRTEYLSTIKRIVHLDYENIILISHEDMTKDVTKKTGDKITAIKPNLQDKAALKVAGMVDIVGRVVVDDDERKIEFKSKSYVFSGGRLPNLPVSEITLDMDELIEVYDEANKNLVSSTKKKSSPVKEDKPKRERKKRDPEPDVFDKDSYFFHAESDSYVMFKKGDEVPNDIDFGHCDPVSKEEYEEGIAKQEEPPAKEKPKRERKSRTIKEEALVEEKDTEESTEEEKPKRQRRQRKAVDDTPPGEDSSEDAPAEEEKPARTRKRRTRVNN
ncbi:AAA family ATPase [Oceanobacillus profundus]|uniref:AAA family ATPase n=1 Tax=Oceanobacillus TaxID=182709 RepID=UPI0026E2DCAB|nr:AAA family ATPase [Oceanobacillus profundus]MDO6448112.1 AAA family ATPase [Oceanobacillus profundus]